MLRKTGYAQAAKMSYELLGAANEDWWPCTMAYDFFTDYESVCVAKTSCAHPNSKWQSLTADGASLLFEVSNAGLHVQPRPSTCQWSQSA